MTGPIILPEKPDENNKPGVLDNVENRITISVDLDSGQYTFAIGKAIAPYHLINIGALLHRQAMKMIDAYEAKQLQDAMATAQVMNSLQRGRGSTDPFRQGTVK